MVKRIFPLALIALALLGLNHEELQATPQPLFTQYYESLHQLLTDHQAFGPFS